jgi:hypothetical protein
MSNDLIDTDQQNADQEAHHYQVLAHEHEVKTAGNDVITTAILEAAYRGNSAVLKELVDLKNAEQDRIAKLRFSKDFVAMKPDLPVVLKSHENPFTKSFYAKLENINAAVDPVLGRHGFATKHRIIDQTPTSVTVRVELLHRDGHSESSDLTMPLDNTGAKGGTNKTDIQAISSTISYLRRVALCALLNISTGDDIDGNKVKQEAKQSTPKQAAPKPIEITPHHKLLLYSAFAAATEDAQKRFFDKFKAKEGLNIDDITADTFYTLVNIPDSKFFPVLSKLEANKAPTIENTEE